MAPFEALYGRRCRSPLNWSEPGERVTFGPNLVTEAKEKVRAIQNHLKTAQSRQKSYSDKRHRPLEFEIGSWAYLRVSPMKGVHRFGVKGKLAPRYIGPFQILQQCGSVAYQLKLPPHLSSTHDVFHISQLKRGQSRSWTRRNELLEDGRLSRTRCNGVTTLKKKQRGKQKIICTPIIQSFSPKEEICTYSVKGDLHLF